MAERTTVVVGVVEERKTLAYISIRKLFTCLTRVIDSANDTKYGSPETLTSFGSWNSRES
jgi:hypothetical protein